MAPTDVVLAFDLGTGGCKASFWNEESELVAEVYRAYPTAHPQPGWSEQSVDAWLAAIAECSRELTATRPDAAVRGIAISGHSLGIVLLDAAGEPIERTTPIWSDTRAVREAAEVFTTLDDDEWYRRTGNGFTPALYPLFKARWYARHHPGSWEATRTIVGCKDWVNYWLTGEIATDHSYASGSGAYELTAGRYASDLLAAGGIRPDQMPPIMASHDRVGSLRPDPARVLGLPPGVPVFAGAVDNSAMTLGSLGTEPGRIFASFGSSSWMTVTSASPVLDTVLRPYVFAHVIPGLYSSALSTFSSGTSLSWLHALIGPDVPLAVLLDEASSLGDDSDVPVFVPTLGGGTPLEGGAGVRGVMAGLDLAHGRSHLVRSAMEGIAFSLHRSLGALRGLVDSQDELLISGGGAQHEGWNQVYADILGERLVRTSVDQQAAALGAATIAWVGLGVWSGYAQAERAHTDRVVYEPGPRHDERYRERRRRFTAVQHVLAITAGTFDTAAADRIESPGRSQ